ncbi:uncharacterized protein LOC104895780 isoform X4 [Beta vulgaris subsp. vulgaris]|uniref:uncharacterized protein LOC104895780 isoform X4 n=1 Tax=Beta vulgaris subsp. vulgaris TaxID=3555 RepID=UPI002036C359|nr:uncharacterized protein LOC104895780 isoform X4 [Beta vulgaris subsp. vulgaris]
MLNKRSEEGIRGRAEAENMSLTYTRSHWAFYGRCLYSCSQVWFHVNEQLPVGSQKSLPDQAPYMCETALDVSEGVSRDEETLQPTVYLNKCFVLTGILAFNMIFWKMYSSLEDV